MRLSICELLEPQSFDIGLTFLLRAHKAADPSKYPIKQQTKEMYPALNGIEDRFAPTPVHLQVYDGK